MRGWLTVLMALAALCALLLVGCDNPTYYPDLPKLPANASFHDRTLIVQKWAEDSCFYDPAGMADLAKEYGVNPTYETYGQTAEVLWQWFIRNDGQVEDALPGDRSYHAAVYTGCYVGLDKANK